MKHTITISLILFALASYAQQKIPFDLTGDWELIRETPRGKKKTDLEVAHTEDQVRFRSKNGEFIIQTDGNKISWEETLRTPKGKLVAKHQGHVLAADNLSGTFVITEGPISGRQMKWSAKRRRE